MLRYESFCRYTPLILLYFSQLSHVFINIQGKLNLMCNNWIILINMLCPSINFLNQVFYYRTYNNRNMGNFGSVPLDFSAFFPFIWFENVFG